MCGSSACGCLCVAGERQPDEAKNVRACVCEWVDTLCARLCVRKLEILAPAGQTGSRAVLINSVSLGQELRSAPLRSVCGFGGGRIPCTRRTCERVQPENSGAHTFSAARQFGRYICFAGRQAQTAVTAATAAAAAAVEVGARLSGQSKSATRIVRAFACSCVLVF